MATNSVSHQLTVAIGAALSGSFSSVTSGATSKISKIGAAIKDMERSSVIGARSIDKLKLRYNSFLGSMNKQQAIVQKRSFYRSQIMDVVALGAALVAPVKSAMDFETALSDIAAVVQFPESDGLKKFGDTLTEISMRVPMTANDLAKIAASGGAFGVALKDLPYFTEEVAKTTKAWRSTADETSAGVGNLMKTFNISARELPKHFNAINHLGNLTGAAAGDILKAVNRSGDGLANFKLSIPQVAALTSTIMSFGEGAEQAGTLVSGMLQKLSIAKVLGKDAQKALIDIGLSPNAIAELVKTDPQQALDKMFAGLSKITGVERSNVLYKIFGRGASKVVGKLTDQLDLYRKNMDYVSDPKNFAGSRDADYKIVEETTREKLTLLTNTISAFSKEIGLSLLPAIGSVVDSITSVLTPIMSWMAKNKELTKTITTGIAGLISFRIATFALGYASTFLFGGLNRLIIVAKGLRLGLSMLGVGIKTLLFGGFGKFMLAAGALGAVFLASLPKESAALAVGLGDLGLQFRAVVAGSEGLAVGLKVLCTQFRTVASGIGVSFVKAAEKVTGLDIMPVLTKLGTTVSNVASKASSELVPAFNVFNGKLIAVSGATIGGVLPSLSNLRNVFSGIVADIRSGVIPVIEALRGILVGLSVGEIGQVIAGVTLLGFSFKIIAFRILPAVFSVFGGLGKALWLLASNIIPLVFFGISLVGQSFWFLVSSVFPLLYSGFKELATHAWSAAKTLGSAAWSGLKYVIGGFAKLSGAIVKGLIPAFKALGTVKGMMIFTALAVASYEIYENWDLIVATWSRFLGTDIGKWLLDVWGGIEKLSKELSETVATATTTVITYWEKFIGILPSVEAELKVVGGMLGTLYDVTKNLGLILWGVGRGFVFVCGAAVKAYSESEGVLSALKIFFTTIWDGISPSWDRFVEEIKKLDVAQKIMAAWQKLKKFFATIWDDVAPNWNKFTTPLSKLWGNVKTTFPSIGDLFASDESKPSIASKLPPLSGAKAAPVMKNQNVTNNITVNASKINNPQEVAKLVSKEMKNFNWNYLYDPVGVVP
jgi:TP901 family phage tail tape measure protein